MKEIKILVLSTHDEILKTIIRLIQSQPGWIGKGVNSLSELLKLCSEDSFDLVLIGSGISDADSRELVKEIQKIRPQLPVLQHYGGGSGLLFGEIMQVLNLSQE